MAVRLAQQPERVRPHRLAREGAIAVEVAMATKESMFFLGGGTSYNKYSRAQKELEKKTRIHSSSDVSIMDIIKIPQPPKHFKHSEVMECLQKVLSNQDSIAHILWTAFQTQGHRLDIHDTQLETVQERLWGLECVLKTRARQT
jgi:hypothetical protein